MTDLGVGLIGSGFIGKVHALAYRSAPAVFDLPRLPRLEQLADVDAGIAAAAAAAFGFATSTDDWRSLVLNPRVDVVDITTPNHLHEEIAVAAINAGKHVYCEKPLAPNADGARRMRDAAAAGGVHTMVGFNYLKNPITGLAREIIAGGEIGDVYTYRGAHFEDYMHDPDTLVNPWRLRTDAGDGVTSDLGSHAISLARYLIGDIEAVIGHRITVVPERSVAGGATVKVGVPDTVNAHIRFQNGATGTLDASWMAPGHKHTISVEVWGTHGALSFDFERLNELRLYKAGQARGREGFTTILAGPSHPDYAAFIPAPGHQLSFVDLKTIEIRDLLAGLADHAPAPWPDFAEAYEVQRVVDAIIRSDQSGAWVPIADI
ncbi:MAG: Gfo/Idh/MocA family oxidoreductase [Acidimicrobiia bacterium]|nr:Gfo/Idh/MocA family oxidoreductase [Acidimicrobiia bacterium]